MTLYEIDSAIRGLLENAIDPETGEILATDEALDALTMEREQKIENIACYIKNLVADAKAIKDEETALAKRRQAAEKKADRLKTYLEYALQGQKFQTPKCAVNFRKTNAVEIADGFIEWAEKTGNDNLLRYKLPEVNKTAVKALLVEGAEIPGAKMVQNTSISIK